MKNWKFYNALFARILLVMIPFFFCVFLIYKELYYNAILVGFVVFLLLSEMYFFVKGQTLFYDKMLLSILQDDFSNNFPEESKKENFRNLFLLYDKLKVQRQEQTSKERIYQSILNNIDTATLILEKEGEDWNLFLMNDCFSNLFKVPKVSQWKYLKNYLPSLCEEIEKTNFIELKTAISIKIEDQDLQTFVLQTSHTKCMTKNILLFCWTAFSVLSRKKKRKPGSI
ncbi:hypothetical protein [Flavobacterium sp. B183]|uniref:hypothetical protein n=1 Tax=Flavobacterium sp. B183 TaxID=907046 RepID=UPI00201F69C8|nr:hypothetical protein [Flavobacterium sp. B183]URC13990.1 hypothetical protein M4I44_06240 [Flavobacterium sp. B183]